MLSEIWHALAVASMNASNNFLAIHLTMYCYSSSHAVLTVSVCLLMYACRKVLHTLYK